MTVSIFPYQHRLARGLEQAKEVLPTLPKKKSKEEYRWEELQQIENRRRAILKHVYDPFWRMLFHWDGTIFRQIAFDPLLWTTIAIYVIVRVRSWQGELPEHVANLEKCEIEIIGGFLTMFLIIYVNQSYSAYVGCYNDSMACKGRIFDTANLAVATLPTDRATRLIRYMNAAHVAGYAGVSEVYSGCFFFQHLQEEFGLLTDEELERMNDINRINNSSNEAVRGARYRELIAWCTMDVQTSKMEGLIDPKLASDLCHQLLQLQDKIGQLYNAVDMPIPFFYVHFLSFLTALYLPLFAVTCATAIQATGAGTTYWTADLIAGLVVVLQSIFVIGLRILGQIMGDPYGEDLIDLSVIHFVSSTWIMSNRILESNIPDPVSDDIEDRLKERRKSLGAAWGHKRLAQDDIDMEQPSSSI